MVWALSEINSNVETDGKVFPVAFSFALDLGFNILPEHLLFFVGVCCGILFQVLDFLHLNEIIFFKGF